MALALDLPRVTARGLVLDAVSLTRRLPAALDSLTAGAISTAKARCIADETTLLSAEDARRVADAVLARPHLRTAAQTRAALRALVIAADPALARRRELNARSERFVRSGRQVDVGMVSWEAHLPVGDSVAIWQRLCGLADAADTPDDPRRVDARRADTFVDLLLGRTVSTIDGRPVQQGAGKVWRTDVVVAVAADPDRPRERAGARLRHDRYRPPQALADFVRTRDGRCIEPF